MKLAKCAKSVTSAVLILSLFSFVILLVGCLQGEGKRGPLSSVPSQLAKDLIGAWVLVGTPDEVGEPPATGGQLKFRTGRHWLITQADPNTGVVIYHHGGTYTLDGDEYAEKVEYANESTASLINQTYKYKVKVEGDTLTQIGIGNPWTQVWKREK
jgi:hypothetical protein